jgi:excisionase family DNA binding protein
MNKKEAAEFLNLSTRAVERAVARGKLGVRYKKDKHGHVALFNPAELRRYKSGLEVPLPRRPIVEPVTPTTPTSTSKHSPVVLGSVVTLSDSLDERTRELLAVPLTDKLTLSLSEASSLSGLSQDFLLQSIRKNKLKAFKHEKDWRIKRADLDSFIREL